MVIVTQVTIANAQNSKPSQVSHHSDRPIKPGRKLVSQPTPWTDSTAEVNKHYSGYFAAVSKRIRQNWQQPKDITPIKIDFTIMPDGSVKNIRLDEPCGNPFIDQAAVESLKKGAPYPKPPSVYKTKMDLRYTFGTDYMTLR